MKVFNREHFDSKLLFVNNIFKVRSDDRYLQVMGRTSDWLECHIFTDLNNKCYKNMQALKRVLVTMRGVYPNPV